MRTCGSRTSRPAERIFCSARDTGSLARLADPVCLGSSPSHTLHSAQLVHDERSPVGSVIKKRLRRFLMTEPTGDLSSCTSCALCNVCDGDDPRQTGSASRARLPVSRALQKIRSAGLEVRLPQVGVDGGVRHPETAPEPYSLELARVDQPVHAHLGDPQQRGNFGHSEQVQPGAGRLCHVGPPARPLPQVRSPDRRACSASVSRTCEPDYKDERSVGIHCRPHAYIAIAAAAPALTERVEPSWPMATRDEQAATASSVRPGPSEPNSKHTRSGSFVVSSGFEPGRL